MKKTIYTILILTIFSCNKDKKTIVNSVIAENSISTNNDSIELLNLTKNVYQWYNKNENFDDYPYLFENKQDSIFSGINWEIYAKNIEQLKKSNFFSQDFYIKHKEIAITLDKSIKKANVKWRNTNDGIPLWESGADNWCNCQDYPDNYWDIMIIDSLKINKEKANFIWSWDSKINKESHTYKMTATKENSKWKINSISGFKNYYSIEEYDNMLKE